jgi:hypothetical protein
MSSTTFDMMMKKPDKSIKHFHINKHFQKLNKSLPYKSYSQIPHFYHKIINKPI